MLRRWLTTLPAEGMSATNGLSDNGEGEAAFNEGAASENLEPVDSRIVELPARSSSNLQQVRTLNC